VDLWGLSFFFRHVLGRPMEWVDIIKPPNSRSLPDVPTREEVQRLINSVYRLRYRVYFFALYSMGLRLGLTSPVLVLSSDIRNWSSGDTKSGPPCGALAPAC
jgi:integrase